MLKSQGFSSNNRLLSSIFALPYKVRLRLKIDDFCSLSLRPVEVGRSHSPISTRHLFARLKHTPSEKLTNFSALSLRQNEIAFVGATIGRPFSY